MQLLLQKQRCHDVTHCVCVGCPSRFAPGISFLTYVGSQENRQMLRNEILETDNLTLIVTSYEVCCTSACMYAYTSLIVILHDSCYPFDS